MDGEAALHRRSQATDKMCAYNQQSLSAGRCRVSWLLKTESASQVPPPPSLHSLQGRRTHYTVIYAHSCLCYYRPPPLPPHTHEHTCIQTHDLCNLEACLLVGTNFPLSSGVWAPPASPKSLEIVLQPRRQRRCRQAGSVPFPLPPSRTTLLPINSVLS